MDIDENGYPGTCSAIGPGVNTLVVEFREGGGQPDLLSGICLVADLTIGDLSGSQVTSLRAVPLVNVTLDFPDPQRVVDLASNQRCQIQSTLLIWYVQLLW